MLLRQLECFAILCHELSFTRAAEKLGMTQPTLSYQIKSLEDFVGVPLFDRLGRRIAVTEAGAILLKECDTIFSSIKAITKNISELHKLERGTLTIGTLPGELNILASRLLLDFHKSHPGVKIKILGTDDVEDLLLKNKVDLALTVLPYDDDRIIKIPLYQENFYLAVSTNHPIARNEKIEFNELKTMPIVMFPTIHQCRKLVDTVSDQEGFMLDPIIETSTPDSIISIVKAGAGAAILSKTLLEIYDDRTIRAIKIENPSLKREIGIVYLKDKFIGSAAQIFIDLFISHIKELKVNKEEILV